MNWLAVRTAPGIGERNAVLKALFQLGSQGVHEEGDALLTHFPPGTSQAEVERELRDAGYTGRTEFGDYAEIDWSERWKDLYSVQNVGRLRISPPWLASTSEDTVNILIEPGMAFGTGEHASTRCALHLLQKHVRSGDIVADLGAGSAILSIAAARAGARRVAAIENDPDAIENAEHNIRLNEVEGNVILLEGDAVTLLPLVAPVSVIVANIVSSVLTGLLPAVRQALARDGIAILSGILIDESDEFRTGTERAGWRVTDEKVEGAWYAVAIQ